MKKILILLFIILILPLTLAQDPENYNTVSSLTVDISVASEITKQAGELENLQTTLKFYPKAYSNQEIISQEFEFTPDAELEEGSQSALFRWGQDSSLYNYGVSTQTKTSNQLIQIKNKVNYPVQVPEDVAIYTLPSEFIDLNSEMNLIAEEIVAGQDDVYKIAFDLAMWTQNNIAYNLTTLTAKAVKPSSWVLENRQGVCDEMTNLYISLLRSRGIPARFASGLVYTNTLYDFGAHGWAEVYIDGKWVPVDVTFGTFGWISPGHIKFTDSVDSGESSVTYEWTGRDLAIFPSDIDISAEVISSQGTVQALTDIEVLALSQKVGPSSHVPIEVTITNNNPYYVPLLLTVTTAPGLVESNTRPVLLEPSSEKTVYWTAIIDEEADPGFTYSTDFVVESMLGAVGSTSITYASSYETLSQEESSTLIERLDVASDKAALEGVTLACSTHQEKYSTTETIEINCAAQGELAGVEICFENECSQALIEQSWTRSASQYTSRRLLVTAEKDNQIATEYFDLVVIESAGISISDISPQTLGFSTQDNLEFDLISTEPISDVIVEIGGYGTVAIESLEGTSRISVPVTGKDFYSGKVNIEVTYTDALGQANTFETQETINVTDIPFTYKILATIKRIFGN